MGRSRHRPGLYRTLTLAPEAMLFLILDIREKKYIIVDCGTCVANVGLMEEPPSPIVL